MNARKFFKIFFKSLVKVDPEPRNKHYPDMDDVYEGQYPDSYDAYGKVILGFGMWVIAAVVAVPTGVVVRFLLTPPGLAGLLAVFFRDVCRVTGQCNLVDLQTALVVSIQILTGVTIALIVAVRSGRDASEETSDIHQNVLNLGDRTDDIKGQLLEIQDQIRMLQWNLVIKGKLDVPGAVISHKTGEVIGFMDENIDPTDEREHLDRMCENQPPAPWTAKEITDRFGQNLERS
jgi:hypothetical protein